MALKVRRMSRRLSLFPSKSDESDTEATEVQETQEGIDNEVFNQEEDENQITDLMTHRISVVSFGKEARKFSRSSFEESKPEETEPHEHKTNQTSRSATKVRIDSSYSSCKECSANPNNMAKDIENILIEMNKDSKDDVYQNIVS